jgi:pilus assembly protein CpaE
MNKISCLIIESDQEAVRHIDILGRTIGSVEVRWKTNSLDTGTAIIRKHLPEMTIVGLGQDPEASIDAIATLSRDFPSLFLLALSDKAESTLILRAMRAGAHDFLCKPVKEIDLRAAAEKVYKLKAARMEKRPEGGRILSVFSNKGGNGTTTIAVNLADALVRYHGKKVAVVDLVLSHGDVTMFFNVNPSYSIIDLARNSQKADYDFLHTLLVRHSSGVYILADPPMIEDAELISPTQVREVLQTLRSMFDYIVVDTPHQFDERTLTALEMSDTILLVSLLNLPSLRNTQKCLELFGRIGLRDERVRLVISRFLPNDEIPRDSIEGILNCPVFFSVPNDYPAVIASVNRGKLLFETFPTKEVTKSFRDLSNLLASSSVPQQTAKPIKRGLFDKIFPPARRTK